MPKIIRLALLGFAAASIGACASAGTTALPDDGRAGSADQTVSATQTWPIRTREHLDLWLHGYAMIQDDTSLVPLFKRGYKTELQGIRSRANMSTQLDANMAALRARFIINPQLGNAHFLPLQFGSPDDMRAAINMFIQADGDPRRATSEEGANAIALLARYFPTGQDRDWLRLFWQSLNEESARFYHDYWLREQANRALVARAIDALWQQHRPALQTYMSNSQQGNGTVFLSLPLNGEGRTLAAGRNNTLTAVTFPASESEARDAIYVIVHELMFAAANTAVTDNITPTEQREGLGDRYIGAAAVRSGLMLIQKTIPSLADGYARYYLRAANRSPGTNPQTTLASVFPLPETIRTALTRQLDVVLGGI
ncbi:MAG: hypothetical protein NUW01_12580 [Gemmatimonadaceae bacterium]|nr:hypothetical protein [Gemmatimonadaceae bacterium]